MNRLGNNLGTNGAVANHTIKVFSRFIFRQLSGINLWLLAIIVFPKGQEKP